MNLLGSETSPYLLQHKDNPVHWQPWGEQAFEQAKKEQKPVLVSIGYSSCHWCHVMEHESFQDESIAEIMNEFFINIKVDREEYPDVDHLYMDAVQAMTGSGGWPLNVFVTPDKQAFYGGTYFPPQRVQNRASWRETLLNVHQYYQQHPTEVQAQAARLIDHLQKINERPVIQTELPSPDLHQIAHKIMAQADTLDGGFGHAPKFPSTHALQFLIQYAHLYKKPAAEEHVFLSLDKMAAGGLYDHMGGGFARYSTDNQWVVPHFEKMLYDNALLLEQYAQAYLITQKPNYKRICLETVEWLVREMTDAEGGFYSAQDADSEGEEGKFYCWTYNELCTILGEEVKLLEAYYHLLPEGNWEHQNIFFTRHSIHDFPVELKPIMGKLFQERKKRIPPLTDTKVILGWNALMAKALVVAGIYCQEEAWIELAESNVHYILKHFKQENGNFWHTRRLGISRITAYADDLVYLMNALVELSKVRGNSSYLEQAIDILELLKTNYKEETSALYSYTHQAFMQTSVNKIDTYDGALPSVNAVLCSVLNYLSDATLNYSLEAEADRMLQVMRPLLDKHPSSFACWALCLLRKNSPWRALHITGTGAAENYKMLLNQLKWNHHVYYVGEQSNINIASFYNVKSDLQFSFCTSLKCLPPLDSMESATRILQED